MQLKGYLVPKYFPVATLVWAHNKSPAFKVYHFGFNFLRGIFYVGN